MAATNSEGPWKHNTLRAVELARIDVETAKAVLEQAYAELQNASRVHRASEEVEERIDAESLCWDDAVEEMRDEVWDYGLAEAILRNDRPELEV